MSKILQESVFSVFSKRGKWCSRILFISPVCFFFLSHRIRKQKQRAGKKMKPHPLFFFDDTISFIFEWSKSLISAYTSCRTKSFPYNLQKLYLLREIWQFSSPHPPTVFAPELYWCSEKLMTSLDFWSAHIFGCCFVFCYITVS